MSANPAAPRALVALLALLLCLAQSGCGRDAVAPGHLRVTLMDIGEADCMLIETADSACLIDAGEINSDRAILKRLRAHRVLSLDLVVLTHPHSDHTGGLLGIARHVPVGQILDSGFPLGSGVQRRLIDWIRRERIPYRRARAGQVVRLGKEVTMEVLWPPDAYLRGTESDANNNSAVLRVTHGRVRLLVTGDIQSDGETQLLASGADLAADVLKVAHQGSADSTSGAFLEKVRPSIALISAGRRNAYGHPAPETLDRLKQAGVDIYRTDISGDLVFESDGAVIRPSR